MVSSQSAAESLGAGRSHIDHDQYLALVAHHWRLQPARARFTRSGQHFLIESTMSRSMLLTVKPGIHCRTLQVVSKS